MKNKEEVSKFFDFETSSFLKMQPSSHCVAKPCTGDDGDKGDYNDTADSQHQSGPGERRISFQEVPDEKLNAHA